MTGPKRRAGMTGSKPMAMPTTSAITVEMVSADQEPRQARRGIGPHQVVAGPRIGLERIGDMASPIAVKLGSSLSLGFAGSRASEPKI